MKNIIFISTFVLSQTLLATTLTIYSSGIALIQEQHHFGIFKNESQFIYEDIPNSIVFDSLYTEFPEDVELQYLTFKHQTKKSATITFNVHSDKTREGEVALRYLTKNINFTTDYILNINDETSDLSSWVNIYNNSGKDFKDTDINLLAGDINRVDSQHTPPVAYKATALMSSDRLPKHKALQNYHLYRVPFQLTLNSGETKRLKLFEVEKLQTKNRYSARAYNPLYLMGERTSKVEREIELPKLQKVLPAGRVRIYTQEDKDTLLLGEVKVANTPKNTPITLKVGQDFDTKVLQKVISRDDTKEQLEALIEYKLINNSTTDKIIELTIPFNKKRGSSIKSKLKYRFTKGNLATFTLKVKAQSERSFEVNFKTKR